MLDSIPITKQVETLFLFFQQAETCARFDPPITK